ncbi:MAG: hypothetical protein A3B47_04710 [Candidatus Levybacteria bacterium RIFCSPLOWO2_01_FULL_39_24]|nr:MAG: hypothetical protein A2800_04080 [Candidatus Levybacteria bacterium RIFCSPHIGHO2_01_FULL_40_16]OGH28024.1 MAG: hypothetical protein A3E12_01445 [Candidatus Levybacteria bacterium RIFCSPHIGHO2_12_FULL_39_9]OGH46746.1 MAG: hypothetical protein A3B47_04710 [Candidatus Levybacteria bacterium RIFCSPLOWO2_01_FULL_39_24]
MQNFWNKEKILLLLIILFGAFFRLYGLNWDQGSHLHPDERAIVMFSLPLHFPSSVSEFLSVSSPLNPHFFAYGSFPLYLLKATGTFATIFNPQALSYDQINLIGRFISAVFDTSTLLLIFLLGKKIFSKPVGLLGTFFYAISVFPIQAAHFYAVDTILTFFILLTLYAIIVFYERPTKIKAVFIGVLFGASLATKTSALPLIISIGAALISDFVLIFIKNPHRPRIWFPHLPKLLKTLFVEGVIIAIFTFVSFLILEPYALLDFKEFWRQTLEQSQMTRDAFAFPYTLQYVGKIPYLYELKNIFLWGQGPILAMISFIGILYALFLVIKKKKEKKWAQEFILLIFFLSYLVVVGKFAVGWMRYVLPLYPILCLFGGLFAWQLLKFIQNKFSRHKFLILNFQFLILLVLLAWPLSFMHIYTQLNTRVLASEWIYKNIPADKIIAREHWDDGLPFGGKIEYESLELPIYGMTDPLTEKEIRQKIQETDYIIIASNRLYTPLQRIAQNCKNWNILQQRCPQNANAYYQQLFNGKLGFKKVAEFENPPTIPLLNVPIDDQGADESFTVYDHPKIMIFKKTHL